MKFWPLTIVACLIMGLCLVRKETQTRLQYQVGNQVATDDGSFGYKFVVALGNPEPSPEILLFMQAWHQAEGGHAQNNYLNTTMPWPGDSKYNTVGVRNYATEQDGLDANIATITNGRYGTLLGALQTNDVALAIQGLRESPWGTSADLVSTIYSELPVPSNSVLPARPVTDARSALVAYALELQGVPYRTGGGSGAYRAGTDIVGGGDCSSTMQHIYHRVLGIDIGTNTFNQFTDGHLGRGGFSNPNMRAIRLSAVQPGDLWYGVYPNDEHTGMVVGDVTGDGTWDLIDNGGKKHQMGVNNDFLNDPYFMDNLIGFGSVLP